MSNGEAAIEFDVIEDDSPINNKPSLLKDLELPVLAPLCLEEALLDIEPNAGFSAYYPLVWEPMEEYLKDIHTIYYAPSGELYNVPFHAIYAPKGVGTRDQPKETNEEFYRSETESEEDANS